MIFFLVALKQASRQNTLNFTLFFTPHLSSARPRHRKVTTLCDNMKQLHIVQVLTLKSVTSLY